MGARLSSPRRRALVLTVGFLGLAALLGVIGALAYLFHSRQFEIRDRSLMDSILPLKDAQLDAWLQERRADLGFYVGSPAARDLLAALAKSPSDEQARRRVSTWFSAARTTHPEYLAVSVLNASGRTLWSSEGAESLGSAAAAAAAARKEGLTVFAPLQPVAGRALTLCARRAGPVVAVFHVDATSGIIPSLEELTYPPAGSLDFYLARQNPEGAEILDHDPAHPGFMRSYQLPPASAAAQALRSGALSRGPDHFGESVLAMPAPKDFLGWRPLGVRELGAALGDSRMLALVFGLLGAAGVGCGLFLTTRLLRSAETEGAHAILQRDSLMEHAPDAIVITSIDSVILHVNPAACRLYGYSEDEMLGRPLSMLRMADESALASERIRKVGAGGSLKFESVHRTKDGTPLEVEINASLLEFDGTKMLQGIIRDVTQQRKDVRQLSMNRRMLDKVTQTLPTGIYAFDLRRGAPIFLSPAFEKLLGYSPEEILRGSPAFLTDNFHPEDFRPFLKDLIRFRAMKDGESYHARYRFRVKSGDYRWFHSQQAVFERDAQGAPTAILGSLEDCTEEVVGRLALTQALARARLLTRAIENAAEGIVITDQCGAIQFLNPAAERATGFTSAEAVGQNTRIFKSGRHPREFYRKLWETILRGDVWQGTFVNRRKDGSLFEEEASIAPVKNEAGDITNFVAVKRDISRERSLEAQLTQAQRLEAVGRLAGGIAHDFNNILTSILGYAQLAKDELPEGDPIKGDLAEIETGAQRAADLTRQLLIFSRRQVVMPRLVEPAAVVGALQKMLRRIIGEHYHLVFTAESSGTVIKADPSQLEQVVMNFVVNSHDAMPAGGDIRVSVRDVLLSEPLPGTDGSIPEGAYVSLSVDDSGAGIPQDALPHIFEPFFTTKPPGQGTGLGLATVYGIVKQGGAHLAVESSPKGTRMTVYWPVSTELPKEAPPSVEPKQGGSESILLVEDEAAVRRLSERLLTWAGYTVTPCAGPEEALAQAAESHRLLLTDVVMPKMSGKELAERLHTKFPALKVLYTSGYSDDIISKQGMLEPGARLLPKPFTQEALFKAVRDALDA